VGNQPQGVPEITEVQPYRTTDSEVGPPTGSILTASARVTPDSMEVQEVLHIFWAKNELIFLYGEDARGPKILASRPLEARVWSAAMYLCVRIKP
jgi:hypothetical protein